MWRTDVEKHEGVTSNKILTGCYGLICLRRHIQAEGETREDLPPPFDQRCTQRRTFLQHSQPHPHRGWRRCYLCQTFWHQRTCHHPRPNHQCSPQDQALLPQLHLPHGRKALLHRPRHLWQFHNCRHSGIREPIKAHFLSKQTSPPQTNPPTCQSQCHRLRHQLHQEIP